MMDDEMLDYYGDMFLAYSIKLIKGITFEQFLTQPNKYIDNVVFLTQGNGLNIHEEMTTTVELS